ncbi:MAG: type III glutamate--ammonia ligase [Rhodospirillaceae bacterium]|jgi:glutamine synthetase|nr:type III glutamate--ammonia ligase [Rhodospirillaceae bacterium]MBT5243219.1 type III glutamate--ammonia ligase [Rhodospirillaceae bacterium]MBT6243757.1 type III glutamate--ammonia ligase [Rhodospirillaceae bacterium]MBT7138546.1 type III glutamate--ammonia ligase [Rhodospirillaceae bacterium]
MSEKISNKSKQSKKSGADWARQQEELIKKGVKYCFASYVDAHGIPKGKTVPVHHFERMMRGSELFTGAALDGLGQGPNDDELAIHPDASAVTQLPWRPEIAWCPGNLKYHDDPWHMCSRTLLSQQVERAAKMGYGLNLGIECELYVVDNSDGIIKPHNPNDTMSKAAYDFTLTLEAMEYLDEVVSYMNELGWDVYSFDHEDANGQYEFDFAYADVLTMADRFVLWRLLTKEIARRHGWEATFMPKPYIDRTGSGAHFNMSLTSLETGKNISGDSRDPRGCGLSKVAYQFLGGIKKHAKAIVATTCPTVNSYKRLVKTGSMTGYTWAPVFISYGGNNRTHMLRVPKLRPEVEGAANPDEGAYLSSARWECRAVDTAMNPYLAAAMMLGAGLNGIEQDLDPGDPLDINMYEQSDEQLEQEKVELLPRTLLEAIEAFDADPLAEQVLGAELKKSYVDLKSDEWWDFHNQVSSWEIDKYLTKF